MGLLPTPRSKQHKNLTKSHRHAPKMEKAIAKRLGGKVVKGSGCGTEKGDVRIRTIMRVEAKCTAKKSFTVTREMVEKIESHALASGELPAIEIEFLDPNGQPSHRLAVMPTYVLEMICQYRREEIGASKKPVTDSRPAGTATESDGDAEYSADGVDCLDATASSDTTLGRRVFRTNHNSDAAPTGQYSV